MRLLPWIKMPAIWLREGELEVFGWASKSLMARSDAIAVQKAPAEAVAPAPAPAA